MKRISGVGFHIQRVPESSGEGRLSLRLFGVIDEHADLEPLAGVSAQVVRIDVEGVRRINSFGVRSWIEAMRRIPAPTRVVFERCPPPFIDQCNMVAGFLGHGAIESFYVPLVCEGCDDERDALYQTAMCLELGHLPEARCDRCGKEMVVDDLEEQYLLFLRD